MTNHKNHFIRHLTLLGLLLSTPALAEDKALRASLFTQAENTFADAKKVQAELLAPDNYAAAAESFQSAEKRFEKGTSIERIQKDLDNSISYLQKAIEAAKLAEVTLANSIQARLDAISAQAEQYAPEAWANAQALFKDAAEELEDGDVKGSRKYAEKAEVAFHDAELIAIKANYLDGTRQLLAQAQKTKIYKQSPQVVATAQANLNTAERLLSENRYDSDEARYKAQQANFQIKHATLISDTVLKLGDDEITPEGLILQYEGYIKTIGNHLDLNTQFHEGYEQPLEQILAMISSLQKDSQTMQELQLNIQAMQEEMARMEEQLGVQSQRIANQDAANRRITEVESLFAVDEAIILTQAGNPIIRLIGLNFDVGSSQIKTEYFPILRQVQLALAEFPGRKIIIEGHTDSFGSDDINLALSTERAQSVRQYLLANMTSLKAESVEAIGYGEGKPIASNENDQGRKKNRRIDIRIIDL